MTHEEFLAAYTVLCAGCGKRLVRPHKRGEASAVLVNATFSETEGREVIHHGKEAMEIRTSSFNLKGENKAWVCQGRRDYHASVTCRLNALRKVPGTQEEYRCVMCGQEDYSTEYPLPCKRCTAYALSRYQREADDKVSGARVGVSVNVTIDGLYAGRNLPHISEVFGAFLNACGIETTDRPTEELCVSVLNIWASSEHLRVMLTPAQRSTLKALLEWLTIAVAEARVAALQSGSNMLQGLIRGDLTIDALNNTVAERSANMQRSAAAIQTQKEG